LPQYVDIGLLFEQPHQHSIVWGGIHTRTADEHGTRAGRKIGVYTFENIMRPL
jgi:hypothetical protein